MRERAVEVVDLVALEEGARLVVESADLVGGATRWAVAAMKLLPYSRAAPRMSLMFRSK